MRELLSPCGRSLPRRPRLLVVDDDRDLLAWLAAEADEMAVPLATATTTAAALASARQQPPDCAFVDVHLGVEDSGALVRALRRLCGERLPVASISASQSVPDRLAMLVAGTDAYLVKPVRLSQLLEAAQRICAQPPHGRHRVLLFGARDASFALLGTVLEEAGVEVLTTARPDDLVSHLQDEQPDLALLLGVPGLMVEDACRLLRADAQFDELPIVVIPAQHDRETCARLLRAGADDYLSLPVFREEIEARVLGRLRRLALLRALTSRDPLTGLYNRRYLETSLRAEVHLAAGTGRRLALAMLDIDHFKDVNDRLGHPAGDAVLRELAADLRASFRRDDLCARYGGEEFVVLVRDVDTASFRSVVDKFRARFAAHRFSFAPDLRITLSAGISAFPDHARDPEGLVRGADEALYASKHAGRDISTVSQTIPAELVAAARRERP